MTRNLQPVTGMKDVLAAEIGAWQHVERTMAAVLASYGYGEIRVPVVEHTELFKRAIGEYTDVVEKEMYTFTDHVGVFTDGALEQLGVLDHGHADLAIAVGGEDCRHRAFHVLPCADLGGQDVFHAGDRLQVARHW